MAQNMRGGGSEWTDFSNKMGSFFSKHMWNSWPAIEGEIHIWHER
jgi:hypothetical protein